MACLTLPSKRFLARPAQSEQQMTLVNLSPRLGVEVTKKDKEINKKYAYVYFLQVSLESEFC